MAKTARPPFPPLRERVRKPVEVRLPAHGVVVIESHHAPGFESPVLQHDFAKLILVIAGEGRLDAGGGRYRMRRDVLLHVPAGIRHRLADTAEPVSLYAVCYRNDTVFPSLSGEFPKTKVFFKELNGAAGALADAFRSDVREMLFEQDCRRVGWEAVLQARVGDLLVRALRMGEGAGHGREIQFEKGGDTLERVAAYAQGLAARFFVNETLDQAARAAGISRRRFTDLFRKVAGAGPGFARPPRAPVAGSNGQAGWRRGV